jgi:hypothetical protein
MRKNLFSLLLLFFSLLITATGSAQKIDSMMGVYADRIPPEKIHIHFDKSVYNRGDTIWYKVYILQGKSSDTAAGSMNVYLEWYDADGKPITHTASPVIFSTSAGSFDIPGDYKGGSLHVKAFTRWMLNEDPAFSYQRDLVINTNATKTVKPVPNRTTLTLFPEGGFLVQGLRTRVAFKATNQYGNPVLIKGVLVEDNNNSTDSLRVQHDGMGSFYLAAQPGHHYQVNWTDENGAAGSTPIPITKTEGAQLTITRTKDKARFQVERTLNVPENFRKLTLIVHMNRVGLYQVTINTSDKTQLSSEIPVHDLPTGLLQFSLFTSDWIPVAERILFINNHSQAFDVKLTAPLVNTGSRAKNAFEILVPDTLFTHMSLSITDAAVSPPDQHTIFSDILLSSEIRGKVYNPAYYLSGDTDSIAAHLDLIMLTNGWRRFDWDRIRAHISPKVEHPVETGYMQLTGKVSGIKKNSPETELNLIVLHKDSSRQYLSVPVAKDGAFAYPLVFFDTAKLFFSFNNNKSLTEKARLEIENGLLEQTPKKIQAPGSDPSIWNNNLSKQRLDILLGEQELLRKKMAETTLKEVTVTTKIKTKLELLNEKYTTGMFRGNQARRSYAFDLTNPDRPIVEIGILQYLQNRVPGLAVNCNSMLSCGVRWTRPPQATPEFYVNEMPANMDMVLSLAVHDIALVKAFPPPFFYSSEGMRTGAIAIYTKKMEDYKQPEVKGLPNLVLAGYTKFKEFYNPSYEQPGEGFIKPDNRTTLYWNPNLITNSTQRLVRIEFFNNDFTKTFKVVLEGINAAGKMTRVVKMIEAGTRLE